MQVSKATPEREWRVVLAEREDGTEFGEGVPDDPGEGFRVFEWRGAAPSVTAASDAACEAWTQHYGKPVGLQHRADVYRVK
jgi:hypothetical protein